MVSTRNDFLRYFYDSIEEYVYRNSTCNDSEKKKNCDNLTINIKDSLTVIITNSYSILFFY